jgi:hypothetical protein
MLSHFVRKDAKNWDEYVPYAAMAYRAMPQCSTKYSPYYLVFGTTDQLRSSMQAQRSNHEKIGPYYTQQFKKRNLQFKIYFGM